MPRGFILQPSYRLESGRPVIRLFGTLDCGSSFLVRDTRHVPHFYVLRGDAAGARRLGARVRDDASSARRALDDGPVVRVELRTPQEARPLRERLAAAGIRCYEADVRFAYRYLIDRGLRSAIRIDGSARSGEGVGRVYDNPRLAPADWTPRLSVLSVDIETDPRGRRLLSIALASRATAEVLLLTPPGLDCPAGALPCRSEGELLRTFARRVRELDPDVLTGWNVVDFDLAVLLRVAERTGVPLGLGRGPGRVRLRPATAPRGSGRATIPGRVVLDGIDLVRGAYVKLDSFALDAVAGELLGKRKTIRGPDRAEEILRAFERDRPRLVEYNLCDARLVLEILDALHLVELAVERSRLTGMPLDRVGASIAAFDFLYLSELTRRGVVAPSARAGGVAAAPTSGGHVLEPRPGLHRHVLVLDFRSLYPSVIRTFHIDPLGYLPNPGPADDPIVAPNGAAFRRERGILPGLLDELFPRREAAKRAGDRVASQAIKILMNSFYGVLGTTACRFASAALANAITGFGREILLWSKARLEAYGYDVLYGDTDSLFVLSGLDDASHARELGARLVERLNGEIGEWILERWRVESRLELEFDRLYLRLLLLPVRHGTAGARKRYAGLVEDGGRRRVAFTGMEVVRRDWTALAKRVQRELYERLFDDRPVEEYLREVVAALRAGQLDELLVYRKALRKRLEDYTAATPPHVAAARKMRGRPGRVVSYVVTRAGPEPAAERRAPLDHEHYVQKQVRPVAEPVLAVLGLEFDRIIGDDTQLRLF